MIGATILVEPGEWRTLGELARAMEDAGWTHLLAAEGPYSGWSNGFVANTILAENTERMIVGNCIAIVDYRHPWTCAAAAGNLRERTGDRYVVGLGVSHPAINNPIGIHIEKPIAETRRYVNEVRRFAAEMPWGDPTIYLAGVLDPMVKLAGEVGDGVIFHHNPLRTLRRSIALMKQEAEQHGRSTELDTLIYARIVLDDDLDYAYAVGRDLTYEFFHFPVYQQLYRRAGWEEEVDAVVAAIARGDRDAAYRAITAEFLDDYLVLGPASRCREKLQEFEDAGIDVLLLAPLPLKGVPLWERFRPLLAEFREPG